MILYVNGDSHTTAAEANNQYIVAGEDPKFLHLGPLPHPENLSVSWGKLLSITLRASFHCGAFSNHDVDTIINSTGAWLEEKGKVDLIIIQWPATIADEEKIWQFHQKLNNQNIKHIFFNSSNPVSDQFDWGNNYITDTYEAKLQSAKLETVTPNSKHFGKDGHSFWNRFLLNYIVTNKFI
jgi:hypothetical protein